MAIEAAAFEPARRSSRRSLVRALGSPFQRVLVLEARQGTRPWRVAGYVIVWPFRHVWRIYNLASDPAWRQQGIGGTLLSAAAQAAQQAGATRLVLEARREAELLRFYDRRGFRVTRELPDYYAPGEHAVRLAMPLPPP